MAIFARLPRISNDKPCTGFLDRASPLHGFGPDIPVIAPTWRDASAIVLGYRDSIERKTAQKKPPARCRHSTAQWPGAAAKQNRTPAKISRSLMLIADTVRRLRDWRARRAALHVPATQRETKRLRMEELLRHELQAAEMALARGERETALQICEHIRAVQPEAITPYRLLRRASCPTCSATTRQMR